ncbi:sigma factor-like helix-turn-helix DNA-binding protein [Actinospica sp.]|jgi:RNA polymerase sigma-70 factor (ECF subfamily)|uniref:sigma factor-like helix-turn-helix DNA-binding protein n=1 Tax=Actinospica sp. TaxID=1872142 RepID=UPI002C53793D|nr:sigma factor-like helix-turn-helix DNA-binding protein [Actinospica sp.]HWG26461.1 sigma factor-like helix-turn-helix DNA-binding protein [Actinospica sp.]
MGEEEFDAFFSVSYSRLVGQLYALTGDWAEAQDVVLEAYIRAWDQRSHFDLQTAPDSWIRTVAWRLTVFRVRSRRGIHVERDVVPPGVEQLAFVQALRSLGEDERRAAVLRHLCGLSIEDIAVETGVTANAAMASLARGRAALRAVNDGDGFPRTYAGPVDQVYDFANQHAHPRLTAQQVREQGNRRGRTRRSAAASGVGVIAVAGAITVALLAGSPTSPTIAPSAAHPTVTHHSIFAAKSPRATPSTRL